MKKPIFRRTSTSADKSAIAILASPAKRSRREWRDFVSKGPVQIDKLSIGFFNGVEKKDYMNSHVSLIARGLWLNRGKTATCI